MKELLRLLLCALLILETLPSHALTPLAQGYLEGNAERALGITQGFFDGSPGLRPSLAEASPVQPLLIAHNNPALDQACRGIGKGPDCVSHIRPQDPRQQASAPQREGAAAACDPSIQDCPAKTSGWSRLWSQAKANAVSFPSSEKGALEQMGKSLGSLGIGLMTFFLIVGIPFVAVGLIALTSSLIYFTGSMLYGAWEAFMEIFSFGKHKPNQDTLKQNPLRLAFYWILKTMLFLALLPVSLPVYLYKEHNVPQNKLKRLKDKKSTLTQDRDSLNQQKEALLQSYNNILSVKTNSTPPQENPKPEPLGPHDPLPEVVKIEVPPYEDPAEGIITPPRWRHDIEEEQRQKALSLEDKIESLKQDNNQLTQENKTLREDIQSLQKHIVEVRKRRDQRAVLRAEIIRSSKETKQEKKTLVPATFYYANINKDTKEIMVAESYPDDKRVFDSINDNPEPLFTIYYSKSSYSQTTRSFIPKPHDKDRPHRGLDISAPQGSIVTAEQRSDILYARYHKGSEEKNSKGNMVILHPKESTRLVIYNHLGVKKSPKRDIGKGNQPVRGNDQENSGILVSEGETLKPGTPIGLVGNTGHVTTSNPKGDGTHLHLGVIEVSERNPEMKRLKESESEKEQKLFNDINEDFKTIVNISDPDKRAQKLQNFMFHKDYKQHIYMNPFEAIWKPSKPKENKQNL